MVVLVVLFAVVVVAVMVAAHWYVWRRLVRDVSRPKSVWRRTGTVLIYVFPLCAVGAQATARSGAPFTVQQAVAWPGYLWLACLLYLLITLAVGELVRPVLRAALRRRDARAAGTGPAEPEATEDRVPSRTGARTDEEPPAAEPGSAGPASAVPEAEHAPAPSRRLFVARAVGVGAAVAAGATVGTGAWGVLNGPTLKHVTVPLAKLPRRGHGYRIAVVSDIHLGPVLGRAHTQRIVDRINGAQPDLVAIVGDLVDGSVENLGAAAEPLGTLRARHGSYFVTGNHEYFGDAREWIDHVRELGVHPMENVRKELPWFDLAGVNDLAGEDQDEGPDYDKALGGRDTSRASVLLAHQPVMIHDAVDHGVDLQLSGHTHGGQMWPVNYLAALENPTLAGLERYGDTQLYVTRGAGAWGPPVRVGAESDVTIVELASKQA